MLAQRLAPVPVALMKNGVEYVGSCNSSATMSAAIGKGPKNGGLAASPASKVRFAPRDRPNHNWLVLASVELLALSFSGSGTLPSAVWPYQNLLIACACAAFRQAALLLAPTTPLPCAPLHSTDASRVGS